jgi:hypothetical protein
MPTTQPVTEKKLADQAEATPAHRESASSRPSCPVVVRYTGTMRLNRVYPLTVQIPSKGKGQAAPPGTPPLTVRPILPGAVVTPPEQKLDPTRPGSEVVFQVISLAKGPYRGARVQVEGPGQAPQEIRVGMRAKTQRMTWVLLALTIGVTWALLYYCKLHPLEVKAGNVTLMPGTSLKHEINGALTKFLPSLPSQQYPWLTRSTIDKTSSGMGDAYQYLIGLSDEFNVPFWVGLSLLALTCVSWLFHRQWRAKRRANLLLPKPGAEAEAMETLPLSSRPLPITVEPI